MWTRAELKSQAKAGLKGYYWWGVLIVLTGIVVSVLINLLIGAPVGIIMTIIPLIGNIAAGILVGSFLTNLIEVGLCSFFTKSTRAGSSAGIADLFQCFQKGRYMTAVSTMFFRWLHTTLWTLLLIIPGIVKSYEYRMVSYLAAEYPEKDRKEIFALSKKMMDGNKFSVFVLDLSFIGWYLLGIIACGVGILFVAPYYRATNAELYLRLKEERLGIPRESGAVIPEADYGNSLPGGTTATAIETENLTVASVQRKKGYLVGIEGEFTGANIPVEYGSTLMIGRDPSKCNVVISGQQTSRVHVKIEFDGNAFRVTDLSSLGTFDLQTGALPKNQMVIKQSGTYLQLGTGGDIFMLECK